MRVELGALPVLKQGGIRITDASIHRVQPGFSDPASLALMRISISQAEAGSDTQTFAIQRSIVDGLNGVAGVTSVGMMDGLLMTRYDSQDPIFASDHGYADNQTRSTRAPKWHTW